MYSVLFRFIQLSFNYSHKILKHDQYTYFIIITNMYHDAFSENSWENAIQTKYVIY